MTDSGLVLQVKIVDYKVYMKAAAKIFNKAKASPRSNDKVNYKKGGSYNVEYMLSHEQLQAGALLKISEKLGISLNQAAEKYYIDGASIEGVTEFNGELINNFFGDTIGSAIRNAKSGSPSFIAVDDGHHFILLAIVPDLDNPSKLSVVYVNSIPENLKEYQDYAYAKTGKSFAKAVLSYINDNREILDIEHAGSDVVDISIEQQYANCCGLSVASNIASVTAHCAAKKPLNELQASLFKPHTAEEKKQYYTSFGDKLFQTLDNPNLDLDKKISKLSEQAKINIENIESIVKDELVENGINIESQIVKDKLETFRKSATELFVDYEKSKNSMGFFVRLLNLIKSLFGIDIKDTIEIKVDKLITEQKNEILSKYTNQDTNSGQISR